MVGVFPEWEARFYRYLPLGLISLRIPWVSGGDRGDGAAHVCRAAQGSHLRRDEAGRAIRLDGKGIERVVAARSRQAQLKLARPLTPHDLRSTFITLALEGKAPLHLVQYAAGHKDPRTTEHYQRRKEQLDDNAVDYIHF